MIARLVLAVRIGDPRQTEELLYQFSLLAEFEDLAQLRAALEADLSQGRGHSRSSDKAPEPET